MIIGLTAWIIAIAIEALAYLSITKKSSVKSISREIIFGCVTVFVVILTFVALADNWRLWLLPSLFVPYQLLNIARAVRFRLQPDHLRRASLRTLLGLFLGQIVAVALGGLLLVVGFDNFMLAVVIAETLLAIVLLVNLVKTWLAIKPPKLRRPMSDSELPSLSVLIPARDETIDLQNCLSALVASDYPKLEIIALDDNSSNKRTPEIIRSFASQGVRFIKGETPAKGWLPKNFAYNRLLEEASGEIVLFAGVDVLVELSSLRLLVEVLYSKNVDMLSLLPLRPKKERRKFSFIQAMRYWWEIGWPRKLFKRPPVLSTVWLIRRSVLLKAGGFKAAARSIVPEAYFARLLNQSNKYFFMRSKPSLPIYSTKSLAGQHATAIRLRYPQLHRRMSLVAIVATFELVFLIGPFLVLPVSFLFAQPLVVASLSFVTVAALSVMYYIIGIRTHLNNLWLGILTAPVAFLIDIAVMHGSMLRYEFSHIIWHDRDISQPMLTAIPKLPSVDETSSKAKPVDRSGAAR